MMRMLSHYDEIVLDYAQKVFVKSYINVCTHLGRVGQTIMINAQNMIFLKDWRK